MKWDRGLPERDSAMTALVELLGGIRGTVFAGLALLFALLFGIALHGKRSAQVEFDKAQAAWAQQSLKQAEAYIAARNRAEQAEQHYATASKRAAIEYQRGIKDGQDKATAVAAGVRDGSLKLRKQWDCASDRVPDYHAAAAGPDTDDAAELRATDSGNLVRVGSDADTLAVRLQSELIATRNACTGGK